MFKTRSLRLIGVFSLLLLVSSCSPPTFWRTGAVISAIHAPSVKSWGERQVTWTPQEETGQVRYVATYVVPEVNQREVVHMDLNLPKADMLNTIGVTRDGVALTMKREDIKAPKWWAAQYGHDSYRGWTRPLPLRNKVHHRYTLTIEPNTKPTTLIVSALFTPPKIASTRYHRGILAVEMQPPNTQWSTRGATRWSYQTPKGWDAKDVGKSSRMQVNISNADVVAKSIQLKDPDLSWFYSLWVGLLISLEILFAMSALYSSVRDISNWRMMAELVVGSALYLSALTGGLMLYNEHFNSLLNTMWSYRGDNPALLLFMVACCTIAFVWLAILPGSILFKTLRNKKMVVNT